ncbi:hypothetical protein BDA99DRAFT_537036 [Phascolomyces articulosus]|uniref:Uncharacterized protein n=1 Tax=Phascolomyces articulosus TaxID=60185 RepID=A0AAD5K179_9FUNG|nr:hypothetical protein BDA99DRAFT_537036 [Phascolomyces articulosus]
MDPPIQFSKNNFNVVRYGAVACRRKKNNHASCCGLNRRGICIIFLVIGKVIIAMLVMKNHDLMKKDVRCWYPLNGTHLFIAKPFVADLKRIFCYSTYTKRTIFASFCYFP